jgi:glycosyltransferase involved in cell wall biosynthesis
VGSATPPVLEVLRHGDNGLTVDFFAPKKLATSIESALQERTELLPLREAARRTAVTQFDLHRVTLPRWHSLFNDLINGRAPQSAPRDVGA